MLDLKEVISRPEYKNKTYYGYIYKITILDKDSTLFNRYYIGQKKGLYEDTPYYYGSGKILNDYCRKFGYTSRKLTKAHADELKLSKELLDVANSVEDLGDLEVHYISICKSDMLLNITEGGVGNHSPAWNKGLTKYTDERVAKLAASMVGKHTNQVPWNKGMAYSEEQRKKISEATKAAMRKLPPETKLKMRSKVGRKSSPLSEEAKQKISATKRTYKWRLENGKRVYYKK